MRTLLAAFTYSPVQRWGPISPHGVGTALGFLGGAILMARRAEPRGIPRNEVYNAVTWGAVGALIGARGFYVLGHLAEFDGIGDMVAVWRGGLTMFGGFVGGLALGLWYLRRNGFDIPHALDAAAPGFAVGVIVGRVGDLVIADHLGRPTDFFLGYRIPETPLAPGYGPPNYLPGMVVHHTALYDLIGALLLLGFLYWFQRRKPARGTLFAVFSIWYGIERVLLDFTRNRELIESVLFGLSGSQWAGLLFAAGGAVAVVRIRSHKEVTVAAEPSYGEFPPPVPAEVTPPPTIDEPTTPPPPAPEPAPPDVAPTLQPPEPEPLLPSPITPAAPPEAVEPPPPMTPAHEPPSAPPAEPPWPPVTPPAAPRDPQSSDEGEPSA